MLNNINISGPLNIIRLEKNKKVIYLLGDYHLNIDFQNECEDYDSISIEKFIYKFLIQN